MVQAEREGAAALSRFLQKNRLTPPYLGAYPSYFTSYNYLALERVVALLVEHQKSDIAALEDDLAGIHDAECRKQVQQLVETKKSHLKQLDSLPPSDPRTAA